ncbi:hypothetical protein K378_01408 [Streptomyces sp. Amel2xB2]|uniref:hypothetical protein n=1 Tax=Streptomyces sp. Amel2xB2 TaxID=1305829 RepID=UPI000DB8FCD7|nr:hypothetical protein [Streptomyces sp. Amel2xB2]RAJ70243.1 hypothetical protein K378_01408 [Streptomyces sp. Amel2xB2]
MKRTVLFDFENAPAPKPFTAATRVALRAEWLAAKDRRDLSTGRDIIRVAKIHDEAWPDEASLYDQITGRVTEYEQIAEAA